MHVKKKKVMKRFMALNFVKMKTSEVRLNIEPQKVNKKMHMQINKLHRYHNSDFYTKFNP